MRLAKKPLWHTRPRHVPVLWYGHRYPYRGKLTCRSASGKRFLAPRGTPVEVYFRVWHLSFKRYHGPVKFRRVRTIRVGRKGRVNTKLGFRSGRTVLFRYHGPRKELAKAKLRLAIPPPAARRPGGRGETRRPRESGRKSRHPRRVVYPRPAATVPPGLSRSSLP